MSGLRLAEMDSVESVDVMHYLFEEDLRASTAEQQEAKSATRTVVYESLYGRTYRYKTESTKQNRTYADGSAIPSDGFFGGTEITEFDPVAPKTSKPYVPPTEFNPESPLPFGKDLDAPLG